MGSFLKQRWFLISLCLTLAVGMAWSETLLPWVERLPRKPLIAGILFATTLPVDMATLLRSKATWGAALLAILFNAGLAPPLAWLAGQGIDPALANGLVLAAAAPCTVASAIVWTRRGGGNDAVAAMVTLLTNFGCFLILPFWTALLLGDSASVDPWNLMRTLLLVVAAPMALAQVMRRISGFADWASHNAGGWSVAAQSGLLLVVLTGAVLSGIRFREAESLPSAFDWMGLLVAIMVVHLTLLAVAWRTSLAIGLPRANAVAVAIAGSQKTLTVALGVAIQFGELALFPLILYHLFQLVADTVFVDRIRSSGLSMKRP